MNEDTEQMLLRCLKDVKSLELKLEEAKKQVSDWRRIETQHLNDLNNVKKLARELSSKLFSEPKSGHVQDWSPAG